MHTITNALINELGGYDALSHDLPDTSVRAIRTDMIDHITDGLMRLTADLVATLIDAGSEREAVEENDALRDAIREELTGWTI